MSSIRVWAPLLGAVALSLGFSGTASAQSLSPFGNWGEAPERSSKSTSASFLGGPAVGKALSQGGGRPSISPRTPQTVSFDNGMAPGSIVIDSASRKLYYTLSSGSAYVYPIAVGKQGFAWSGVERVSRIEDWPDWIPPAEMRQRMPTLPVRMTGGVRNPLGAKAIYLGNTLYRIHGTNDAKSIGSASSSGCFRMHNSDVVHLASHVNAGTVVYVMKRLPKSGRVMPQGGVQAVKKQTPAPEESQQAPGAETAPAAQDGGTQGGSTPPAEAAPSPEQQPSSQGI